MSRETNQRDPAAWLTFISSSSKIYSQCLKDKSSLEYSYAVISHPSVVFSGLQVFVCQAVLTFLLYNGFLPVWLLNSGAKQHIQREAPVL